MSHDLVACCGVWFSPVDPASVRHWTGPAIYAFVRRDIFGGSHYLYFGECEEIGDRLGPQHEKWRDALALGMNEVHVHLAAQTRANRLDVERYLRNSVPTPLNQQNALMQMAGLLGAFAPAPEPTNYLSPFMTAPPARGGLGEPYNALAALEPLPAEREPVNALLAALLRR